MSRERVCMVALYKTITQTHLQTKHSVNDHNVVAKVNDGWQRVYDTGKTVMSETFPQMVEKS